MQAWVPFYCADYVADTGHLSLTEHGVYLILMCHYYNTGKPLPASLATLHRICRANTDYEQEAVVVVLTAYFQRDGDTYRHRRIDRELEKTKQLSEIRRENGKRGGLAKARHLLTVLPEQKASILQPQLHKETTTKHVRPTLEEVKRYCIERQNGIDAAKWFDYYSANGWHVGRHAMKDWKAAVRHWERNNYGETFRDDYQKTGRTDRQRPNTQVQRWNNNLRAAAAAMDGCDVTDSPRQAPRLGSGSVEILGEETGKD